LRLLVSRLSYRHRNRGGVWLGVAHACAFILVGLLALGAALMESEALIHGPL
jgi:hypothetical protein